MSAEANTKAILGQILGFLWALKACLHADDEKAPENLSKFMKSSREQRSAFGDNPYQYQFSRMIAVRCRGPLSPPPWHRVTLLPWFSFFVWQNIPPKSQILTKCMYVCKTIVHTYIHFYNFIKLDKCQYVNNPEGVETSVFLLKLSLERKWKVLIFNTY